MRLLVFGASGMLGHKLVQVASRSVDTFGTIRYRTPGFDALNLDAHATIVDGVAAEDADSVVRVLGSVRPDVVVNCVGIVKQSEAAKDPTLSVSINGLFPHRLASLCRVGDARLIHVSTDCVFSGRQGFYGENDEPDPVDMYGRTKLVGEVVGGESLTIRTSIIGRELAGAHGLMEWFLAERSGRVRGFRNAIFSGFTTVALSRLILQIATSQRELDGLYHVASESISKFDLLALVNHAYDLGVSIEPDDDFHCDRSLNGARFLNATGFSVPSWPEMIDEIRADNTPYDSLRGSAVAVG
jgi:dTDP-4-dehydrorhamnose reductase